MKKIFLLHSGYMYPISLTLHGNVIPLFGAVLIAITIVIPLFFYNHTIIVVKSFSFEVLI
ncbi:MAG: hypothetical protein KBG92_01415 [Spirochaetes bacterium]|jgi:hypothetical protein|nr:hypothetical protein [Spirochaetota bacterium]